MARNALLQQAQNDALVRYGPEKSQLKNILRDALTTYQTASATADQAATAITQAAKMAKPQLSHIYNAADQSRRDAQHEADLTLGALANNVSTPLGFALQRERAAQHTAISNEKANALADVTQRAVSAQAGRAYQKQNALATYNAAKQQVGDRALSLAQEEGAFTQSDAKTLRASQQALHLKRRGQDITKRGQDLTNARAVAQLRAKGLDKNGNPIPGFKKKSSLTPAEVKDLRSRSLTFFDKVGNIRGEFQKWIAPHNSLDKVKQSLQDGKTWTATETYQGRNSKGQPVAKTRQVTYKIPQYGKTLSLQAAYELEKYGYLTAKTVHKLRVEGNIHVPKEFLPPANEQLPNAQSNLRNVGQQVARNFSALPKIKKG